MLFATFDFLLFLPVALVGFWALARRPAARTLWLLALSYFFYMAGPKPAGGPVPPRWYFVGLIVASTFVDYAAGLLIAGTDSTRRKRLWLSMSLALNLGLLGYFKYTGFLSELARALPGGGALATALPAWRGVLPVGISFYTFQSLSYTLDVYRGRLAPERNPLRFALFVAFFPQLVAGPIVRAGELLPELARPRALTRADVDFAVYRVGKGILKKVVLADFVAASFTDRVFASPIEHGSLENLLALYAFTLQIYADFSGYSDIAIGVARLFGVRLPENFRRPYQAVDISDFWRRWHITLSSWLRDYVYYPLGGSRLGPGRTYLNLFITLFLVGMWHGASFNFVVYALLQASAMVFNRFCRQKTATFGARAVRAAVATSLAAVAGWLFGWLALDAREPALLALSFGAVGLVVALLPSVERAPALRPLHVLLTVHFSLLTRIFFRADTLETARAMAGKLLHWDHLPVRLGLLGNEPLAHALAASPLLAWAVPLAHSVVLWVLVLGFALHYVPERVTEDWLPRWLARVPGPVVGLAFAAAIGCAGLLLAGPRANIYFAF